MRIFKITSMLMILILLEISFGPAVWSQDTTSQLQALSKEIKRAEKRVRYQAEQTVYAFAVNRTFVTRFRVKYSHPYRMREAIEGPEERRFILLEDGEFLWSYFPARKMVVKEPLPRDHNVFPALLTVDLNKLKNSYVLGIRGPVPAGDVQCRIVEFLPRWADRPRREIWLEKQWNVPVRVYISSHDGRPTYTSELHKISFNPKFEEDTFKLKVPQDTKVYEVRGKANLSLEDAQRLLKCPVFLPQSLPRGYAPYNIVLRIEGLKKRLQVVYSDGLSSFSVFQESTPPGGEQPPAPAVVKKAHPAVPVGYSRIRQYGLINVLTFYHSGYKTVFVGDVRKDRLLDIAETLPQTEEE